MKTDDLARAFAMGLFSIPVFIIAINKFGVGLGFIIGSTYMEVLTLRSFLRDINAKK